MLSRISTLEPELGDCNENEALITTLKYYTIGNKNLEQK